MFGKVLLIFVAVIALVSMIMAGFVLLGKTKTLAASPAGISAALVADGTYEGHYSAFRWSNAVEAALKNHQISAIYKTHPQVFSKPETIQTLINRVLTAQDTKVDGVSGATADSNAFLLAVENALNL